MKKILCLALVFSLVVSGFVLAGGQREATTQELSFAHVYEPDLPYHQEAVWAANEIARRTNGRFTVTVYPASQLGSESEIAEGLTLGTVDMIYGGAAFLAGSYGPIAIAEAPFIYRDFDHWLAFADSSLMDDLAAGYRQATSHHIITPTYYGARHITSNRPINTPDDMRGLNIRVPNAPLYLLFPRAAGANPTPVAFAEVYLALQQGVVEAQENPLPTIRGMAFYEVQDYINLTGHMVNTLMTVVRGDLWDSMSAEDQAIFSEVWSEAAIRSSQAIYQEEQELGEWFESQGLTVLEPDRRPFMALVEPLLAGPDVPWTADHLRRMKEIR